MKQLMLCVGVLVTLVGFSLQASNIRVKVPRDLGNMITSVVSQGQVHRFIEILQVSPHLQADTVIDANGNTILHELARHDQAEMIAFTHLLGRNALKRDSRGSTIDIKNNQGESPKDVAHIHSKDAASKMLDMVSHPTGRNREPKSLEDIFAQAAYNGDKDSVITMTEALIWKTFSEGGDIDAVVSDAVFKALEGSISRYHNDIFDYLVALLPDDYPALMAGGVAGKGKQHLIDMAAKVDNVYVAKYYSDRGDMTPGWLNKAARYGSAAVALFLIEAGIHVDNISIEERPIEYALLAARRNKEDGLSFDGQLEVAKLLIERGAKLSSKDKRMLKKFGVLVVQNTTEAQLQAAHAH